MVNATDVENRLEELPYRTLCVFECKQCSTQFDSLEDIREHCDGEGGCKGNEEVDEQQRE